MREVRAKLILENQGDRILADAGHLESTRVRRVELDALVDTGAVMTLLPQDVVEALGLPLGGNIIVTLANDEKVELPRARQRSLSARTDSIFPIFLMFDHFAKPIDNCPGYEPGDRSCQIPKCRLPSHAPFRRSRLHEIVITKPLDNK